MDRSKYGPWALVAGGSEGVGAGFVEQLAAGGFSVMIVGRKPEPLEQSAERARAAGAEVRTLSLDLTAADALDRLRSVTDDVEVGLLIYNAGANSYGSEFVEGDIDRFRLVIDLNTTAKIVVCHHFAKLMKDRGRGGIMLIGSTAGYRGSPWNALYNAAKAFSRVFAEGLWYELKDHNVDVVEFVVGAMRTPAMARRGMVFGPDVAEPAEVAREGLAHLSDGPVWVSDVAGGVALAEHLQSFPRSAVIAEAAEGLRRLGLYPPRPEGGVG
jgi:short-subunit dehydrogenase